MARDKEKKKYISEEKPSPYKLAFEIELSLNPHSMMISDCILDPLKWITHLIIHAPSPKVSDVRECMVKNPSPTLAKDKAKLESTF